MNWNLENLTYDQLDIIRDRFTLADKVTANKDLTGLGFPEGTMKTIVAQVKNVRGKILVINDLGFHIAKGLLEKGAEKVYLLMTQFITVNKPKLKKNGEYSYKKNGEISTTEELVLDDKKLYNLYKHLPIIKENDKIVLITVEEFYKMENEENKFDLIIANPPYNMGNTIISNCVDKAKECVVLMPFSKYKANELYKHVLSLEIVDPKAFKDATITNNLCVCKLIPNKIERTFEELELETFDQKYREFYEFNMKLFNYAISAFERVPQRSALHYDHNPDAAFALTARTALDGVHNLDGGAYDVLFNIKKSKTIKDTPVWKHADGTDAQAAASYIYFNTSKEKNNLVMFWYYNPLMNSLLKGLNRCGGDYFQAIPNIDWSIDRDYEHLTYEELLQIMKDELKNQKK